MPKNTSAGAEKPFEENTAPAAKPGTPPESDTSSKKKSKDNTALGAEARVAAMEARLAEADTKAAEARDQLLRTAAEYENFRKRSQKEYEGAYTGGLGQAVLELLPVLDALSAAANADTVDEEYKKGVLMTLSTAQDIFTKLGVQEIEALGKPFDPALHNAVMREEADGAESGTVTRVMQKGYTQNEKVIRYAMVAVAP